MHAARCACVVWQLCGQQNQRCSHTVSTVAQVVEVGQRLPGGGSVRLPDRSKVDEQHEKLVAVAEINFAGIRIFKDFHYQGALSNLSQARIAHRTLAYSKRFS